MDLWVVDCMFVEGVKGEVLAFLGFVLPCSVSDVLFTVIVVSEVRFFVTLIVFCGVPQYAWELSRLLV